MTSFSIRDSPEWKVLQSSVEVLQIKASEFASGDQCEMDDCALLLAVLLTARVPSRMRRRPATADGKEPSHLATGRKGVDSEDDEGEADDVSVGQPPKKRVAHAAQASVSSSGIASGRSTPVYGTPSQPAHQSPSTSWPDSADPAVRPSPALVAAYRSVSYPDLRTHPTPLRTPAAYTPQYQPSRGGGPLPPIMGHPHSHHQTPPPRPAYHQPQQHLYGQLQAHGHPPHHAAYNSARSAELAYASRVASDPFRPQHPHAHPDHNPTPPMQSPYYSYQTHHHHQSSVGPSPRLAPLQETSEQHHRHSHHEPRRHHLNPAPMSHVDHASSLPDPHHRPASSSYVSASSSSTSLRTATPPSQSQSQPPAPRPSQPARAPRGLMSLLNDSNDDSSPFFHRQSQAQRPPPTPPLRDDAPDRVDGNETERKDVGGDPRDDNNAAGPDSAPATT
jgi:hypothetical protein